MWVARWLSGMHEVDVVFVAADIDAAQAHVLTVIKDSGMVPDTPVLLAPLMPMQVNATQFSSTAARN